MTRLLLSLALAILGLAPGVGRGANAQPNLIAIVTDDQAQWAVGAYGNRDIHTPSLDRLAREGALFTNAFVSTPVCSPSRASYFTGQWPSQLGITDYLTPEEGAAGLGISAPTWPELLVKAGYRTALFGKWHLGTQPQFHPHRHGLESFVGFLGGGNTPMNPVLEIDGRETRCTGALPDLLTDAAIHFLRTRDERPFLICLHFRAPHRPYGPVPDVDRAPYAKLDPQVPDLAGLDVAKVKQETLAYYASISSVDRNVGRLLDALDELNLASNTVVSFTSDHGYNVGRHLIDTKGNGNWIAGGITGPKRPNMWDTSIRVPLLMRWPGVVEQNCRIDETVTNLDMYRTVAAIVGIGVPADCRADGRDFSPALRGGALAPREEIFGQYDLHNDGLANLRMVRTPEYKFVRHCRAAQMDELYDLQADPDEKQNLLRRNTPPRVRKIHAELRDKLTNWQRSIEDPLTDE